MVDLTFFKGIIIAKSDQMSNMWLKIWLFVGEHVTVGFGQRNGYSLLDPVDLGDIVELSDTGGPIRKLIGPGLPEVKLYSVDGTLNSLKVKVNFMPLDFLLFPASAKAKNLRMAMTPQLGPIPIVFENNFELHRFYEGKAILSFDKTDNGPLKKIEEAYQTPWHLEKIRQTKSKCSNVESAFRMCRGLTVSRQGLVVDGSLRDVFFVHCADFSEMVALRKNIADGQIDVGDWLTFVALDVQEAEKSNDQQHVLPDDGDRMSFFNRKIASFPSKIDPLFRTSVNGGKVQLIVDIEVPINPTHNGTYAIDGLGKLGDTKGLIGVKNEQQTISVLVQCCVNIEQNCTIFSIAEICSTWERPQTVSPPPTAPVAACPAPLPMHGHGSFLRNIESSRKLRTMRITPNTTTDCSGGKPYEAAPVTDENRAPWDNNDTTAAFRNDHQQHQSSSASPSPPLPMSAPPTQRRKPTNSIELETIVVEVVNGRVPHCFCFCFDYSQRANNYIVRIGLNDISQLPTLGQWVRVVMKQEFHGKRVDCSLWEAQIMDKIKYDTDFSTEGGVRTVLVRVQLKVSSDGFYNQFLGPVSDITKRLKVPPGNERRLVDAWCRKIMPLSLCFDTGISHWEVAMHPEEEWQDEQPLELPTERKSTFKLPFVGSRYRSTAPQQQQMAAKEERKIIANASTTSAVNPSQQQPMAISKPNQQPNLGFVARVSPAMDSSDLGLSPSSKASTNVEPADLIDLFDEKCSIGKFDSSPPQQHHQHQDGGMYPHTGVIASVDFLKSGGYYVYSNEFDNELFLSTEESLEKGSWIKFNLVDDYCRLTIGQYAPMKRSPFDVRVERNTIYMHVSATITDDALLSRVLTTSYVKKVYDQKYLLKAEHVGKKLLLELKRGKVDGFCWTINKLMMVHKT